jgi:hypothetical protein
MHVSVHSCVCVRACVCAYVRACIFACMQVCMQVCWPSNKKPGNSFSHTTALALPLFGLWLVCSCGFSYTAYTRIYTYICAYRISSIISRSLCSFLSTSVAKACLSKFETTGDQACWLGSSHGVSRKAQSQKKNSAMKRLFRSKLLFLHGILARILRRRHGMGSFRRHASFLHLYMCLALTPLILVVPCTLHETTNMRVSDSIGRNRQLNN